MLKISRFMKYYNMAESAIQNRIENIENNSKFTRVELSLISSIKSGIKFTMPSKRTRTQSGNDEEEALNRAALMKQITDDMAEITETNPAMEEEPETKPCIVSLTAQVENDRRSPMEEAVEKGDDDADDADDDDDDDYDHEETWQDDCSTVEMRDTHILDNELYTDCVFSIGPSGVQVKCHRVYLAKSSPVFSTMFYKVKSCPGKEQIIHLPDVNVQPFRAMIKYIYSGKLDLSEYNYKVVCELLSLAKKYKLCKRLLREIRSYLWENILIVNVWTAIEFAKNNDEPQLLNTAWKAVQLCTLRALKNNVMLEMSSSTMVEMLEKNFLQCGEIEIFNACKLWAQSSLSSEGIEITTQNIREKMLPLLPHIRFLLMTQEQFTTGPVSSGILTEAEMLSVYVAKTVPSNLPSQLNISSVNIPRNISDITNFTVCSRPETFALGPSHGSVLPVSVSDLLAADCVQKTSTKNLIVGVQLPSQNKPEGVVNDTYKENLTVFLIDQETRVILEKYRFIKDVQYDKVIDVVFDPIARVEKEKVCVRIIIKFHRDGTYPRNLPNEFTQHSGQKVGPYLNVNSSSFKNSFFIKKCYFILAP